MKANFIEEARMLLFLPEHQMPFRRTGKSWVILHCKWHKGGNGSKDSQMREDLIRAILQRMLSEEGAAILWYVKDEGE